MPLTRTVKSTPGPTSSRTRSSSKTPAPKPTKRAAAPAHDPTRDEALLALGPTYAAAPDMPVSVAERELTSLSRLAHAQQARFSRIGITADKVDLLARFARRLGALEKAWQRARGAVKLTAAQRKLRDEAEALDAKLVAGGRWGCRNDAAAQAELSRIADGSGLADTIQDLRDLVDFWSDHESALGVTDITRKDLERARALADALEEAAANEASDASAARALELRNRCFWAADELAKDVREGGRYAFRDQPKIAARFVSRHRATLNRRSRLKSKKAKADALPEQAAVI
ncbi:hypothetical protein [Sorangium cellulosum]|uniref:Uncharacterized protein n=1 Tax=Sorangium cellulosum TaxID=56 RepID=A0A150Q2A2_SORCE|nr:hypothetical protein [Sorangium cellulosum]KYF62141.1 hypothetical protein BE15_27405 [Sorangium cellulosum]